MIRYPTVHESSQSALQAIFATHFPTAQTVLDPTYGGGVFWRWEHGLEITGGDTRPIADYMGDCRSLPFEDKSFDVVVLDPPFLTGAAKGSIYEEQYTVQRQSLGQLVDLYVEALAEAWRVARLGAVVKCQDAVESGKFVSIHHQIMEQVGEAQDIAITVRRSAPTHPSWKTVQHLRSHHSYFLVWKWRS